MRDGPQLSHLLSQHWPKVESHQGINSWQLRTLAALMRCRTDAMGGHMDACSDCGAIRISYNSCRNRHCPKCQGKNREQWIAKREEELLPVPYFHVVFTLPDRLNELVLQHPKVLYNCLFDAAWQTILCFGKDHQHLGARTGMIAILHSWGQTLSLHPHLHCIVPGGGLTQAGKWKAARSKGNFLFPVKAMSKVFRAKYVEKLKAKLTDLDKSLINSLFKKDWVIYAKRPFAHPKAVVEYLGRYTHKVAISNSRIKSIEKDAVTFAYKDYRKGAQQLEMSLEAMEFIRRFSLHILPKGFVRIRHYGILSSTCKPLTLSHIRLELGQGIEKACEVRDLQVYNPTLCPCCGKQTMVIISIMPKRGPPKRASLKELTHQNYLG